MKRNIESRLEEIVRDYGSLAAYNEEQRRFGLISIEATLRANPFDKRVEIGNPEPQERVEARQVRWSWPRFLFRKA